jgi:hypothetical protein
LRISKSQYIYGSQCLLRLWYYRNRKDILENVEISNATQAIFDQGQQVGELAMTYFKSGVEVKAEHYDLDSAHQQTQNYIKKGKKVIYEAYACSKDGMYSRIDILKKVHGKSEWDMIEVKSSTSVKSVYIDDMAAQRHAFVGAGFKIRKSQLMYINNQYIRNGDIDPKELFTLEDCTEAVVERIAEVKKSLPMYLETIELKDEPCIEMGKQCKKPYPCPYINHCESNIELPDEESEDDELLVDKDILAQFVMPLKYPLYFLDYETINMAVPPFDGMSPFKQYTFQYSLHIQKEKGGELVHKEYLHSEVSDPRLPLVKQLIKDCKRRGSVVVYSMSFEASRNKELARDFPEYSKELLAINERMVDLAIPFRKKGLAYSSWGRSYSIKIALPAFVPDLSYSELAIQGGGDASTLYAGIMTGKVTGEDKEKILNDLKEYCGLDTLAMVRLLDVIYSKI